MDAVSHYFVGALVCVLLFLTTVGSLAGVALLWVRWSVRDDDRNHFDDASRETKPWSLSAILVLLGIVLGVSLQTFAKFWGWPQ